MKTENRFIKLILVIAIALAVVLPVQAQKALTAKDMVTECKQNIQAVSVTDAKRLYDSGEWIFLDVRTEKEYKRGNIPKAVHLQRGVLEFKIDKKIPDKSANIVVYCKSGSRSTLSVCTLTSLGYSGVVSMEGGWMGWVEKDYPIS